MKHDVVYCSVSENMKRGTRESHANPPISDPEDFKDKKTKPYR